LTALGSIAGKTDSPLGYFTVMEPLEHGP